MLQLIGSIESLGNTGIIALVTVIGVLFLLQPLLAQTWSAVQRLTWNSGDSYNPAVAVGSNNHVHVVWYDTTPRN